MHHPPTFTGGGDPMVADHWFMQVEKVLEAMEITSGTTRIRLWMICHGCELEISGTLFTVDLRIIDMSKFDVILGMIG